MSSMSKVSTNTTNHRLRQLHKARQVRKAGFVDGIQSLPSEIKQQIDTLFKKHYSPSSILKKLTDIYPNTPLPSRTTLYNYRNKHFTSSEVSVKPLIAEQQKLDIEKINVKETLAEQIKQFLVIDVPYFREQMYQETDTVKCSYKTRTYFESMKLAMDMIPKLNISLTVHTEPVVQKSTQSGEDRIKRILQTYGKQLASTRDVEFTQNS